ncbi:hypothetical protein Val02_69090 [Virgisporangium aliadipatigenens]|uniref:MuF-like minor capsid protein n=1 Tax=Virgisporangium aliadipatigenens TaxID=741659 RepID=A0A8J4DUG1_9ACTN|nr:hypothetical protein [Virgisporangium aliadipatigenens]GIJ50023.1 hypothetical protein Val02_69090 [Virgisporangium aliadipatigenens]
MPVSAAGATLTARHRADQLALRSRFAGTFLAAWPVLDPFRLDDTTPAWLAVAERMVSDARRTSAATTAGYYRAHRDAELAHLNRDHGDGFARVVDDGPDPVALRTSLLVTGPVTIRRLSGQGVPVPEAARAAVVRAEAAAARHVLDGGRNTMRTTIAADPVALGWARVTDANPCWLCAMAASRGPVYKTRDSALFTSSTGGQPWHDGCACTAEPVYSRNAAWPGDGRDWARLWAEVTTGLSGEDARLAFRRAVDAQRRDRNRAGTTDDTGPEPETAPTPEPVPAPEPERAEAVPPREPEPEQPADQAQPEGVDPLDGVDLAELSDDALYDLFGDVSADPDTPEPVFDRLLAEMERRESAGTDPSPEPEPAPEAVPDLPEPVEQAPEPEPVDPLDGLDLAALADADLYRLWRDHADQPDAVERIAAELAARDARTAGPAEDAAPEPADEWPEPAVEEWPDWDAEDLTDEQRRIDELVAAGWDYRDAYAEVHQQDAAELERQERAAAVDVERRAGETRDQAVRRMYDEWLHLQLVAAEEATNGYLLTRAGEAAGIDPISVFSGPAARARKWASEELKRWWTDNPRLTFTEFRAQILGRDTDRQAAERIRSQGNDRDFGL